MVALIHPPNPDAQQLVWFMKAHYCTFPCSERTWSQSEDRYSNVQDDPVDSHPTCTVTVRPKATQGILYVWMLVLECVCVRGEGVFMLVHAWMSVCMCVCESVQLCIHILLSVCLCLSFCMCVPVSVCMFHSCVCALVWQPSVSLALQPGCF